MRPVRTPLDQTLALLDRSGRCRSGRVFNDQVLDREGIAGLLKARELRNLLKCGDINRFLVPV